MPRSYHHHRRSRRHRRRHHIERPFGPARHLAVTCEMSYGLAYPANSQNLGVLGNVNLGLSWQQPSGIFANTYGFDATGSQFLREYKNWEQYAVMGCKVKWVPAAAIGTAGVGINDVPYVASIWVYSDPDSYDPSAPAEADFINRSNFRTYDPKKTFTQYHDCHAISASQNVPWQDTKNYNPIFANSLSKATTFIRQKLYVPPNYAYNSQQVAGYMIMTWYVHFRGQAQNS